MAYVDFSGDPVIAAHAGAGTPQRAAAKTAGLTALEWSVVALAQRDRLSSLSQPGRMALAMGAIFGRRRSSQLADPKLEALRRMAVLSWHRGVAVPAGELKAFFRAGFSSDQYDTLLASIGTARARKEARA